MKGLLYMVAILALAACSRGSTIDARKAYWQQEIARTLNPGTSSEEDLMAFAEARGQKLRCYQNHQRQDNCAIDDNQSIGGTRTRPVRLAIIFTLNEDRLASHKFAMTSALEEK